MRGGELDGGDVVPVELVEVTDAEVTDAPDGAARPGGRGRHAGGDAPVRGAAAPGRRRSRRAGVVGALVLVLLAAVVGGTAVLDARREQARRDALAERGWPQVDLDEPLTEVWRAPDAAWLLAQTDDLVILRDGDARPALRALDAATGVERWVLPTGGSEWCEPWHPDLAEARARADQGTGSPQAVPPPSLLLCQASAAADDPLAGTVVRVVDVATGEVDATVGLPGGLISGLLPVAGGAVAVATLPDAGVVVSRLSLPDGVVDWSRRSAPLPLDDPGGLLPVVADGVVNVQVFGGSTLVAVDALSGEPAAPTREEFVLTGRVLPLADGGVAEERYPVVDGEGGRGVGGPEVVVTGPDGVERFRLAGELLTPPLTDGSAGDRVVVARDDGARRWVAVDTVTGAELWSVPGYAAVGMLQVDGVLVTASGEIVATDLRTGERLWARGFLGHGGETLSDGSRVVVAVHEANEQWFVALDVRTGAEAWRTPLRGDAQYWQVLDNGTVLVQRLDGVVAYR